MDNGNDTMAVCNNCPTKKNVGSFMYSIQPSGAVVIQPVDLEVESEIDMDELGFEDLKPMQLLYPIKTRLMNLSRSNQNAHSFLLAIYGVPSETY